MLLASQNVLKSLLETTREEYRRVEKTQKRNEPFLNHVFTYWHQRGSGLTNGETQWSSVVFRSQALWSSIRRKCCQVLSNVDRSFPVLSIVFKRCKVLSNVIKCCQSTTKCCQVSTSQSQPAKNDGCQEQNRETLRKIEKHRELLKKSGWCYNWLLVGREAWSNIEQNRENIDKKKNHREK